MRAIAVIGANFGDEGKGLMVDYFSRHYPNSIVVRYNGGCQAGHTVQTKDGKRHVFSHFCSGSFTETPTFLSEYFVVSPMFYKAEYNELMSIKCIPKVYMHMDAKITTMYDVLLNQLTEFRRGDNRHGTIGAGFGETIRRHDEGGFRLTVRDLLKPRDQLRKMLINIRDNWYYPQIGLKQSPLEDLYYDVPTSEKLLDDYCDAVEMMLSTVTTCNDHNKIFNYDTCIFEGAQGLMLDQDQGTFPHVTRSNTGLKNVVNVLNNHKNVKSLDAVYVTRCYTTRHGAGPLSFERDMPTFVVDETNVETEWQGKLRYAPLNIQQIFDNIVVDCKHVDNVSYDFNDKLAITCCDQLPEICDYMVGDVLSVGSRALFLSEMKALANFMSYGPTADKVELIQ